MMNALLLAAVIAVDFSNPTHGWKATKNGDATEVAQIAEGYAMTATGEDPQFVSPWLQAKGIGEDAEYLDIFVETTPNDASSMNMYYARKDEPFVAERACGLKVIVNEPKRKVFFRRMKREQLPGDTFKFRIDPNGYSNVRCVFRKFRVESMRKVYEFKLGNEEAKLVGNDWAQAAALNGKNWTLNHGKTSGEFAVVKDGVKVLTSALEDSVVAIDQRGKLMVVKFGKVNFKEGKDFLAALTIAKDREGNEWRLVRRFVAKSDGRLEVTTRITTENGKVVHVPYLSTIALPSAGTHKHQAFFAGVEYLEDEESSNTKEIRGELANRIMPEPHEIAYPMMSVIDKEKRSVTMEWKLDPTKVSAMFDSPNRLLGGEGTLMALWGPAVGMERERSSFVLMKPVEFSEGTARATFDFGRDEDVSALLARRFPNEASLPAPHVYKTEDYVSLLGHGWLDSEIREGVKFRHATGSGHFKANMVSDAPVLMKYLAALTTDKQLKTRLIDTANMVIAAFPPNSAHSKGVGGSVSHIYRLAPPLIFGHAMEVAKGMKRHVINMAESMRDGYRVWKRDPKKADYGETLGANHCNGYSAMVLMGAMRRATMIGDVEARKKILSVLDKAIALYHGQVPHGSQPWEMPLHTPDIVSSGQLTEMCVDAYRITGDEKYLKEARHWAYTGLTMTYLKPAFTGTMGLYATCGVMGSTNWKSCYWIGRPVQWCGLVYGAALYELALVEPDEEKAKVWKRIASGITSSGLDQTHPISDTKRQGLLPDSFAPVTQTRLPVPINPGTLEENFSRIAPIAYYTRLAIGNGAVLHVAGNAKKEKNGKVWINCWSELPSQVLVAGIDEPGMVTFQGNPVKFNWSERIMVVDLPAKAKGELMIVAKPKLVAKLPGGVFFESEMVAFSGGEGLDFGVVNWRGEKVREGKFSANGEVGKFPAGYYQLTVAKLNATATFLVVSDDYCKDLDSFFAADSALSQCSRRGQYLCPWYDGNSYKATIEIMKRLGLTHARERLVPGWMYDKDRKFKGIYYLENAKCMKENGVISTGLWGSRPSWVKGKILPTDYKWIYDFTIQSVKEFGDNYDSWEFWNEQELSSTTEPVWEYASALKAFAFAARKADPTRVILPGSISDTYPDYFHGMAACGIAKYVDALNIHTYHRIPNYPNWHKNIRKMLAADGVGDWQIWLTECGTNDEDQGREPSIFAGLQRHTIAQEKKVMEFYPKSTVLQQFGGIYRYWFFMFGCYNEQGGRKDWGTMRRDGSVKPICAAMSATTRALGGAKMLGEIKADDASRAFLYERKDGKQAIVYWRKSELEDKAKPVDGEITLPIKEGNYTLIEIDGRTSQVSVHGGKLTCERYARFLIGDFGLKAEVPAAKNGEMKPYMPKANEDLSIITRLELSKNDYDITNRKTVAEPKKAECGAKIVAWNLEANTKRVTLTVSAANKIVDRREVEIEGFASVEYEIKIASPGARNYEIVVAGEAEGRTIAPTLAKVFDYFEFSKNCTRVDLPAFNDPKSWKRNDSGCKWKCQWDEKEKAIRFDCEWDGTQGAWFYPFRNLTAEENLADASMLEFEVKSLQDKVENNFVCAYVMLPEPCVPSYLPYTPPTFNWEVRRVRLPAESDKAKWMRVGANPAGRKLTFWIRNFRLLK